jgi:hypothetical protein
MGSNVKSLISRILVAISVVLLAIVLTAGAVAASPGESTRRPVVTMTREAPVVIAGRGFAARERIALRAVVGRRAYSKSVLATSAGAFRATFAEADAKCHPYTVTAVGRSGSRATQTRRFNIPPPCGMELQP